MDGGKKVWVPHPVEGFKLGRIVDIGSEFITIEPFDAPGTVSNIFIWLWRGFFLSKTLSQRYRCIF